MGFPGTSAGKRIHLQYRRPRFNSWIGTIPGKGIVYRLHCSWASLMAQLVKNLPAIWETWIGKIPWRGNSPLQYPGLENSMDCIVHGVTKSRTQPSNFKKKSLLDYAQFGTRIFIRDLNLS